MDVPSLGFFLFAAVVAALLAVSRVLRWRRVVLVIANIAFLATFSGFDFRKLLPFGIILLLGYAIVQILQGDQRRGGLAMGLLLLLFFYADLKRYPIVPSTLMFPDGYITVGLSYVIFRLIHLVVDTSQRAIPNRISGLAFLSYTLNFTALVSGPIQLYEDYRKTEELPLAISEALCGAAFYRIILGCFKVLFLGPVFLGLQAQAAAIAVSGHVELLRIAGLAATIGLYAPFVYANFSGYTDVVIGVARFLGLAIPENFSSPFAARGFIEFWTRWHMSLTNWLKRYVYSPILLMLMRRIASPKLESWLGVITYFATFFLIGIWHGRTTEFFFYGFLQGLGVSVNKAFQTIGIERLGKTRYRSMCDSSLFMALSRAATFTWFVFTLLWFWSSWEGIGKFVTSVSGLGFVLSITAVFAIAAAIYVIGPVMRFFRVLVSLAPDRPNGFSPYALSALCAVMFVFAASAALLTAAGSPHLVYKAF